MEKVIFWVILVIICNEIHLNYKIVNNIYVVHRQNFIVHRLFEIIFAYFCLLFFIFWSFLKLFFPSIYWECVSNGFKNVEELLTKMTEFRFGNCCRCFIISISVSFCIYRLEYRNVDISCVFFFHNWHDLFHSHVCTFSCWSIDAQLILQFHSFEAGFSHGRLCK